MFLVLSHLTEAGLKINSKKFKLLSEQEVMLGHVENQDGIPSHPGKYASQRNGQNLPTPAS